MSKSINMWKKRTSLWGTVHSFLVGSEVGGEGGQMEIKGIKGRGGQESEWRRVEKEELNWKEEGQTRRV